jgi:dihydrofolate reductase
MPLISLIAAISENRILANSARKHIRSGNPWNIPSDEIYYRQMIRRHPVIIGRKSYSTMNKPFPDCTTIVLTRDPNFQAWAEMSETEEIFIAGGGQIYTEAIKFADKLYLTIVEGNFVGDIYFPEFADFGKVTKEKKMQENGYKFNFVEIEKCVN